MTLVVADEIPVAFLGVELESEAAHIALGVGSAECTGYRGEARDRRTVTEFWLSATGAPALVVNVGFLAIFVPPCFDVQMGTLG